MRAEDLRRFKPNEWPREDPLSPKGRHQAGSNNSFSPSTPDRLSRRRDGPPLKHGWGAANFHWGNGPSGAHKSRAADTSSNGSCLRGSSTSLPATVRYATEGRILVRWEARQDPDSVATWRHHRGGQKSDSY